MATQTNNLPSLFPDIPRDSPVVDKNGDFTEIWSLGIGWLFQALQENFKNEGIVFPPLSAANIAIIQAIYTPFIGVSALPANIPDISGQTVFDSTNRVPKQFIITYDPVTGYVATASWLTFTLT